MAKATERSVLKKAVGRRKQSESCTDCTGAPPIDNFSLQGLEGTYCTKCYGVLSWNKVGSPITVVEKLDVKIADYSQSGQFQSTKGGEQIKTTIPGISSSSIINFNDLIQ